MKLTPRHFTLHSPDEILPYWFVSHDFAQLHGVESNYSERCSNQSNSLLLF